MLRWTCILTLVISGCVSLPAAGPPTFFATFDYLASDDHSVRKQAEQDLYTIAHHASRPGADRERDAVALACLGLLQKEQPDAQRELLLSVFSLTADRVSRFKQLPSLVDDPALASGLLRALARVDDPGAVRLLVARLPDPRAIRALGDQKSDAAARALLEVAAGQDEEAARAARHALARSGFPGVGPLLEEALKEQHAGALNDLLIFAERRLEAKDPLTAHEIYVELTGSEQPRGRVAAAVGLGRTQTPGSLELLVRLLDDQPDVQGAALAAIAGYRGKEAERRLISRTEAAAPEARAAALRALQMRGSRSLERLATEHLLDPDVEVRLTALDLLDDNSRSTLTAGSFEQIRADLEMIVLESAFAARKSWALDQLRGLGEDVSVYTRRAGFLLDWVLLGPMPAGTQEDFDELPFTLPPDLALQLPGKTESVGWKPFGSEQFEGSVLLEDLYKGVGQATAYAYCEFDAEEGSGLLKVGSDDGVAVWLNGKQVHRNLVDRGLTIDQDKVKVTFRAGSNQLLLKVSQSGGGWSFSARVTDADGRPIDMTR